MKQWKVLDPFKTRTPRQNLCIINGSIWTSSAHSSLDTNGYNGIAEYCLTTNKIVSITPYPSEMNPNRHCLCAYKNKIIIIDGENDIISEFDTSSKKFTLKQSINSIGQYPSTLCINDKIHIMHGHKNNFHHVIYDVITDNSMYINAGSRQAMRAVAVLKYDNKIIKIGGSSMWSNGYSDKFLISGEIREEDIYVEFDNILFTKGEIEWTEKTEWKLPEAIYRFGHILYKHYIIIFGGNVLDNNSKSGSTNLNGIYVLDMSSDEGWREIKHIKCPLNSNYLAVLTPDNFIHLVSEINVWPNWKESKMKHYAIHISTILGSEFTINT